ncbi:hypothetical protein [Belnapia rosea]|nr:hypothetical protein [Belnapia rosea]
MIEALRHHIQIKSVELSKAARSVGDTAGNWIAPLCTGGLDNERPEQAMDVGTVFIAGVVPSVVKDKNSFVLAVPFVNSATAVWHEVTRVLAYVGTVVGSDVVATANKVNAYITVLAGLGPDLVRQGDDKALTLPSTQHQWTNDRLRLASLRWCCGKSDADKGSLARYGRLKHWIYTSRQIRFSESLDVAQQWNVLRQGKYYTKSH